MQQVITSIIIFIIGIGVGVLSSSLLFAAKCGDCKTEQAIWDHKLKQQ